MHSRKLPKDSKRYNEPNWGWWAAKTNRNVDVFMSGLTGAGVATGNCIRQIRQLSGVTTGNCIRHLSGTSPPDGLPAGSPALRLRTSIGSVRGERADFARLVLGCMNVSDSGSRRIFQQFSISARFTVFCTAPNSGIQQEVVSFL